MHNRYQMALMIFVLISVLAEIHVAGAGVIERDWQNPGDGLLTFDDVNHHEWLDLTETQAMSVEDVSSRLGVGGDFEGFTAAQPGQQNSDEIRYPTNMD